MWKWRGRGNPKKQDFTPPLGKASQKTCSAFPHFHKPGDIYFPIQRRRKLASHLTEVIHFGNDFISSVASLRSLDAFHWNRWRLSIGITGGIRRNTHVSAYMSKYLTKDLFVGVASKKKRVSTSRGIRLFEKRQSTGWSMDFRPVGFHFQKYVQNRGRIVADIVRDQVGLKSFSPQSMG